MKKGQKGNVRNWQKKSKFLYPIFQQFWRVKIVHGQKCNILMLVSSVVTEQVSDPLLESCHKSQQWEYCQGLRCSVLYGGQTKVGKGNLAGF